jgi:hypothetical protein
LAAGREDWHASAARAGRYDWSALGGVVLALAVVVAIGLATGASSSSTPTQAFGPQGGAGGAGGPNERQKKKREEEKRSHKQAAPTGKLHKIEGKKRAEISAVQTQNQGYQQIPQGKSSGRKGKAAEAKAGGQSAKNGETVSKAKEGGANAQGAKKGNSNNGKGPGTESNKEKEHPTVGFSVKGQKKHKGSGRKGSSEVSGAGAKKSSPNGQGDESSASTQEAPKSGTPTGAGKAGGEQGNNQQGHATQIKGQASQAVKIQPGYAPSRSAKGGKERNKAGNEEGAGGKARTGQVTGATQVGEEFAFVPPAGGAVPGTSAGLQQNYLESLKWIARLPW